MTIAAKFTPEGEVTLLRHLTDTARAARELWDRWLAPHPKRLIAAAFDGNEDEARAYAVYVAGIHDIGKATPAFQGDERFASAERTARFTAEHPELAFEKFTHQRTVETGGFHTTTGYAILKRILSAHLQEQSKGKKTANAVASIIGIHHGHPLTHETLETLAAHQDEAIGDEHWQAEQNRIHDDYLLALGRIIGKPGMGIPTPTSVPSQAAQVALAAFTVIADWFASSYLSIPEVLDGDVEDALDRAIGDDLPAPWKPAKVSTSPARHYQDRFGFIPSFMQTVAYESALGMGVPGLIIVEEAMGGGKTEAGLAVAEALAERCGMSGVYFALPTMATSNSIFKRSHKWLSNVPDLDDEAATVHLAHSRRELDETYRGLKGYGDAHLVRHPLFQRHRQLGLNANFTVGTIDQLLMLALNAKHLSLRHLAFMSKVVVIDEVHAYDAWMNVYLGRALSWLGYYGIPVVMLSATLDSVSRRHLVKAYRNGRRSGKFLALSDTERELEESYEEKAKTRRTDRAYQNLDTVFYPRLTLSSDHSVYSIAVDPSVERSVDVQVELLGGSGNRPGVLKEGEEYNTLIAKLKAMLVDGGTACVIRNTVHRAQTTADAVRAAFPDAEVILLHSQFIGSHRSFYEHKLNRMFGKDSTATGDRPHKAIVIGTQVLEQSLDVDFDFMVSDLAPMDLLLQRVGRLHRHSLERPALLQKPILCVTGTDSNDPRDSHIPTINRAVSAVYGEWPLQRSLVCLRWAATHRNRIVNLPGDIAPLTEAAYESVSSHEDFQTPDGWTSKMDASRKVFEEMVKEQERRASNGFLLPAPPSPSDSFSLVGWSQFTPRGTADIVTTDDSGDERPLVRDIDRLQLEVVLLERLGDGSMRVFPSIEPTTGGQGTVIPQLGSIPEETALAAAHSIVRLPSKLSALLIDEETGEPNDSLKRPASWEKNQLLRHAIPFAINPNGTRVGNLVVAYSPTTGLEVTSSEQEDE